MSIVICTFAVFWGLRELGTNIVLTWVIVYDSTVTVE